MIIHPSGSLDVFSGPLKNGIVQYENGIRTVPVDQVHRFAEYVQRVDVSQEAVEVAPVRVLHMNSVEMGHPIRRNTTDQQESYVSFIYMRRV